MSDPVMHSSRALSAKVSLADVARLSGVSLSTASKALSGQPGMRQGTRERVRSIAEQLGYSPNPLARTLASGRSDSIGLITHDLSGLFSTSIMMAAERELADRRMTVLMANARGDSQLESSHIEALLSRNVDALLVVDYQTDPRQPIQVEASVHVVYAYAPSTNPKDCSVTCDNVEAGRMAVNHMLECGRRRIAIICGASNYSSAVDRLSGSLEALREAGIALAATPQFGSWDSPWGREETRRLLDEGVEFDALVCQSDLLALGALQVLREAGKRVPQDVAVIGHDDWPILTLNAMPTLTSISNNTEGIGKMAARMAMDAIDSRPHEGLTLVSCQLTQRDSTPSCGG